jgi:hypothetical protein
MNSSGGQVDSCGGISPSSATSASSSRIPISRARITSLRATSMPDRSSRGSGSVNPFALASRTIAENGWLPSQTLNR